MQNRPRSELIDMRLQHFIFNLFHSFFRSLTPVPETSKGS